MFSDNLRDKQGRHSRADEREQGQRQRMSERSAVPADSFGERDQELLDAAVEVDGEAENGAKLDDDREHLPVAVRQVDAEQGLRDAEMGGGTDREVFGKSLDYAQEEGEQVVVHVKWRGFDDAR